MTDLKRLPEFFTTANDLVEITRACNVAKQIAMSESATLHDLVAYERLAQEQQRLTGKVSALHTLANQDVAQ